MPWEGVTLMTLLELQEGPRRIVRGTSVVHLREFSQCRRRHRGSVFILASGPSAADFPLGRYAQYPVLALNGSIQRCVAEGISPLFYLCDDSSFVRNRPELVLQGLRHAESAAMSFDGYSEILQFDSHCLEGRSVYLLERVNRFPGKQVLSDRAYAWSIRRDEELLSDFSLIKRKPNRIGFSLNMARGYFVARTIPYVALQLAYHLGFERAFIVGMDLRQELGRFYEAGDSALPSTIDVDYDDYILPSFKFFSDQLLSRGVFQAYNLSKHSRLPAAVLPKITVSELDELLHCDV